MFKLTTTQEVTATAYFEDKFGNPAVVDGVPVWTVADPAILTMAVSEDGMTATFTATGVAGTTQVSMDADADLGEGVRTITAIDSIQVVPGEAVVAGFAFGDATEQVVPEPAPSPVDPAPVDSGSPAAPTA